VTKLAPIFRAIREYAAAYNQLEELQDGERLPIGDQKTGVIGEFYARLYLETLYPQADISYARADQKGWDIQVASIDADRFTVQVKTVSEYSKSRRISLIHPGWDRLYLVYLDKQLVPIGFWEITASGLKNKTWKHCTMPKPDNPSSGSAELRNRQDRLGQLQRAIKEMKERFDADYDQLHP
jgi:hypothetical protein